MRPKKVVEKALRRYPLLFRCASKVYHRMNGSFRTLSPGVPDAIHHAFRLAKELNTGVGDYYEFGLFRGYALWVAYRSCELLDINGTNFYGFDSFQGLPPVEGIDQANKQFFEGQFACSKEEVIKNLTKQGVDWSKIELIEGYFSESLTEDLKERYPFKEVSVALIDCDLYSSTKDVLNWLNGLVTENSILLLDDWYAFGDDPELGQQKAFREFLEQNPRLKAESMGEFEHHGKTFIMCRQ